MATPPAELLSFANHVHQIDADQDAFGGPRPVPGTLHERGIFTWQEWADALAAQIARAQRDGDPDRGDTYYEHWLHALESLVANKGISSRAELDRYRDAWDHAADRTPHGQPIELQLGDFS